MSQQLIDNILQLPDAPAIVQQIQVELKEEKQRRQQFYNEISENDKAEFINGEVVLHSPVMLRHSQASFNLATLLKAYVSKNELGFVGHEKIMISLSRNDYEPDICFFKNNKAKHFKADQHLFPAPDLVVEVLSKSTEKTDRGIKFKDYEAHKIEEYWIVDPKQQTLEQFQLNSNQEYELIVKSNNGSVYSSAIQGFYFEIAAVFDETKNRKALKQIL